MAAILSRPQCVNLILDGEGLYITTPHHVDTSLKTATLIIYHYVIITYIIIYLLL